MGYRTGDRPGNRSGISRGLPRRDQELELIPFAPHLDELRLEALMGVMVQPEVQRRLERPRAPLVDALPDGRRG